MRTVLGITIILTGLAGLAFGVYGAFWLQDAVWQAEQDIIAGMDFGLESLEVISETLQTARLTITDTATILDSAIESSRQTAQTLESFSPALSQIETIITSDLPGNIYTIQEAMPGLEQAAAAIDSTLRTLAGFQWSATIPIINYDLSFGLGIVYDPPIPLDQSVAEVSSALGLLPEQLTGLEASFDETNQNLEMTATAIDQLTENLTLITADLDTTSDILIAYSDLVSRAAIEMRIVRRDIRQKINTTRLVLSGILVWLALSQAAPLYLGSSLLFTQNRKENRLALEGENDQGEQERPLAEG